ncbi:hypothetical protein, partial [uncultured Streptomyces sp.]|uniref:hypothetical protein n=1 Tax=uncultured Streptomyces sp. TaxID=174707 RepID=UPI00261FB499
MSEKKNPLKAAAEKAADALLGPAGPADGVPGVPGSVPPSVSEPVEPREPLPPKADQSGPETV